MTFVIVSFFPSGTRDSWKQAEPLLFRFNEHHLATHAEPQLLVNLPSFI